MTALPEKIEQTLQEYLILKSELQHQGQQSLYFRLAAASKEKRLELLKTQYLSIRNYYSSHSLQELQEILAGLSAKKDNTELRTSSFSRAVILHSLQQRITEICSYIAMKEKNLVLQDIEKM